MTIPPRTGVLLAQLGSPDAPTPAALRRYLAEFLSDRRVVDTPRWLWWPLLHGLILRTRPKKSAHLYARIWRPDGTAPLIHYTRRQTEELQTRLGQDVTVLHAMRYGHPAIAASLETLRQGHIEQLLVVPLYPQYAGATVGTLWDALHATFASQRFIPALRMARPFYAHSAYINALAARIRTTPPFLDGSPPYLLFSFHGLPQRHVEEGDPYAHHCTTTARLLANALGLTPEQWGMSYQSRFGREPWLVPATAPTLADLPGRGIRRVAVACPGFVSDCLETLEEMALRGKAQFEAAGGEQFHYLPCLNDDPLWLDALAQMVREELSGWWPPS
jgi:ferrochelatase